MVTEIRRAIVFERWDDAVPLAEYVATLNGIEPYVPGQFFKRELPCLLTVLEKVREPLEQIIVDGFVLLGGKPGLGMHLWKSLNGQVAVIGVAKSHFRFVSPIEVIRGSSKRPLYLSAVGIDPLVAARIVSGIADVQRSMIGSQRRNPDATPSE